MNGFYDPQTYDARGQGVPGDVEFFVELAKEAHAAGHVVLEIAAGTGRIAIPIAREGVRIVGLDLLQEMLDLAAEKSAELDNVRWARGDMRDFDLAERFGLVLVPFRSFQHLLTVEDQLACLHCIARHLVPGGRLVIDIFNPDIVAMAQWLGPKRGGLQRRRDDYTDPYSGRSVKAWETRTYHQAAQELEGSWLDEQIGDDGVVVSRVYRGLKLRYTFRYEMEHLLARAGYEIEALYGDFTRAPFGDDSPEMIWVARTPEA